MITGTIKNPISEPDMSLLKKLGYRTETIGPGVIRIRKRKKENVQI